MVTLAIATRNDYKGLWFTIMSAMMSVQNTELQGKLKFAVFNNSDIPLEKARIRAFAQGHRMGYKESNQYSNHYGRNEAVKLSDTKYTVLADSHVVFCNNFFTEYVRILEERPDIGLIHSPFTTKLGGVPSYRSNCFYNLAKFKANLHGSFSHRGASSTEIYPVGLAPHAGYGFRTAEWLDFGGYINECVAHGGGEPYVSFKYWMFGSSIYMTPHTGYTHYQGVPYARSRMDWRRNHTITAMALAGKEEGSRYGRGMKCGNQLEELWQTAEPYHKFVLERQKISFDQLIQYFIDHKIRPFT